MIPSPKQNKLITQQLVSSDYSETLDFNSSLRSWKFPLSLFSQGLRRFQQGCECFRTDEYGSSALRRLNQELS